MIPARIGSPSPASPPPPNAESATAAAPKPAWLTRSLLNIDPPSSVLRPPSASRQPPAASRSTPAAGRQPPAVPRQPPAGGRATPSLSDLRRLPLRARPQLQPGDRLLAAGRIRLRIEFDRRLLLDQGPPGHGPDLRIAVGERLDQEFRPAIVAAVEDARQARGADLAILFDLEALSQEVHRIVTLHLQEHLRRHRPRLRVRIAEEFPHRRQDPGLVPEDHQPLLGDLHRALIAAPQVPHQVGNRPGVLPLREDARQDHLDPVVIQRGIGEEVVDHLGPLLLAQLQEPVDPLLARPVVVAPELIEDDRVLAQPLRRRLLLLRRSAARRERQRQRDQKHSQRPEESEAERPPHRRSSAGGAPSDSGRAPAPSLLSSSPARLSQRLSSSRSRFARWEMVTAVLRKLTRSFSK